MISRAAHMLLAAGMLLTALAAAQDYPVRGVRIIVPFAPGAGTDITARMLAKKLHEGLGQTFIVDNRPGAAGMLGAELVAKSPPDGYNLLFGTAALSVNATLRKTSGFDPIRDLAPITLVSISPQFLIVHPNMAARNLQELIGLAKKHPGKLNVGSTGTGSSSHLAIELLCYMADIKVLHVPYKGGTPAGTALMSGELDFYFQGAIASLANMRAGKVRALAVTSRKPMSAAPDVPTLHSFYPGYESVNWFSLFAPAATPSAVIARLNSEARKAIKSPEVIEMMSREGVDPVGGTAAELGIYLKNEIDRYAKIIAIAKLKPE